MKIEHNITIQIDLATVPVPDLEDPATLERVKAIAMAHAEYAIEAKHTHIREQHKAARLEREGKKG